MRASASQPVQLRGRDVRVMGHRSIAISKTILRNLNFENGLTQSARFSVALLRVVKKRAYGFLICRFALITNMPTITPCDL